MTLLFCRMFWHVLAAWFWFCVQRLHLKFQKRNFILVFDVRPSFRAKRRRCRHTFGRSTRTISADGCSAGQTNFSIVHFDTRLGVRHARDRTSLRRGLLGGCRGQTKFAFRHTSNTRSTCCGQIICSESLICLMVVHSCLWCTARHWEGSSLKAFFFGKRIETRNVGSAPHVAHGFSMGLGKARGNVFSKWTICFDLHRVVHVW